MLRVSIYQPRTPAQGKAIRWVRNVNVWVVLFDAAFPITSITSPTIQRKEFFGTWDSRYSGPNSGYGQALAKAKALKEQWEKEWTA